MNRGSDRVSAIQCAHRENRTMTIDRKRFPWLAIAMGLLAFAFSIPAVLVTVYTVARFGMLYNEEGNHFDGIVVHHAGSEYVYALLSAALWGTVVAAGVFARRIHRRAQAT